MSWLVEILRHVESRGLRCPLLVAGIEVTRDYLMYHSRGSVKSGSSLNQLICRFNNLN